MKCPACNKEVFVDEKSSLLHCQNDKCEMTVFVMREGILSAYLTDTEWKGTEVRYPEKGEVLHVFNTKEVK